MVYLSTYVYLYIYWLVDVLMILFVQPKENVLGVRKALRNALQGEGFAECHVRGARCEGLAKGVLKGAPKGFPKIQSMSFGPNKYTRNLGPPKAGHKNERGNWLKSSHFWKYGLLKKQNRNVDWCVGYVLYYKWISKKMILDSMLFSYLWTCLKTYVFVFCSNVGNKFIIYIYIYI